MIRMFYSCSLFSMRKPRASGDDPGVYFDDAEWAK